MEEPFASPHAAPPAHTPVTARRTAAQAPRRSAAPTAHSPRGTFSTARLELATPLLKTLPELPMALQVGPEVHPYLTQPVRLSSLPSLPPSLSLCKPLTRHLALSSSPSVPAPRPSPLLSFLPGARFPLLFTPRHFPGPQSKLGILVISLRASSRHFLPYTPCRFFTACLSPSLEHTPYAGRNRVSIMASSPVPSTEPGTPCGRQDKYNDQKNSPHSEPRCAQRTPLPPSKPLF